jgi:hypothetical protein
VPEQTYRASVAADSNRRWMAAVQYRENIVQVYSKD